MKLSQEDSRNLEVCIQEIELRTSAEVVLVIRETSGSYRDVAHLAGAIAAWCLLLIAMSVPATIPEYWLPLPMAFVFWAVSFIVVKSRIKIWFAGPKRKKAQVTKAANACFFEKKIFQTSTRCGILIYCSLLEKQTEFVMDIGATRALDAVKMEEFHQQLITHAYQVPHSKRVRGLLEVLRSFGIYLGHQLPRTQPETLNELENRPHFGEDGSS